MAGNRRRGHSEPSLDLRTHTRVHGLAAAGSCSAAAPAPKLPGRSWSKEETKQMTERVRASGSGWESALVPLHTGTDGKSKVEVAAMEVGALCMVATRSPRVLPLRHSTEHMSGNDVVSVGDKFGLATCRIWRWAKYEVCHARHA